MNSSDIMTELEQINKDLDDFIHSRSVKKKNGIMQNLTVNVKKPNVKRDTVSQNSNENQQFNSDIECKPENEEEILEIYLSENAKKLLMHSKDRVNELTKINKDLLLKYKQTKEKLQESERNAGKLHKDQQDLKKRFSVCEAKNNSLSNNLKDEICLKKDFIKQIQEYKEKESQYSLNNKKQEREIKHLQKTITDQKVKINELKAQVKSIENNSQLEYKNAFKLKEQNEKLTIEHQQANRNVNAVIQKQEELIAVLNAQKENSIEAKAMELLEKHFAGLIKPFVDVSHDGQKSKK